jgi:hypothetical protein
VHFWLGLCVYVGYIESRFYNPLPCCKLFFTKHQPCHHQVGYGGLGEVKVSNNVGKALEDVIGCSSLNSVFTCTDTLRTPEDACAKDSTCRNIDINSIKGEDTCSNIHNGICLLNNMEIRITSHQWLELFAKYDILDLQSELSRVDLTQKIDGVYEYNDYNSKDLYKLLSSSSDHFFKYLISIGLTEAVVMNVNGDVIRDQYATIRKNRRGIENVGEKLDLDTEHYLISETLERFLITLSGSPSTSVNKNGNNNLESIPRNFSMYLHNEEYQNHNDYERMIDADYNTCLVAANYYYPGNLILHLLF